MRKNNKTYSITAILAVTLAIISFIPLIGKFTLPIAFILSLISLIKENSGMVVATLIIGIIKLAITPILWLSSSNYMKIYVGLIIVNIVMIIVNNRKAKKEFNKEISN